MDDATGLQEQLADSRYWVRLVAVRHLVEDGGPLAVSRLLGLLESGDETIHTAAANGLIDLLSGPATVAPGLAERLEHPDAGVRWRVVWVLGHLRDRGHMFVPAILARLTDDDDIEVRRRAAAALGTLGVDSAEVVAALVAAVEPVMDEADADGYGWARTEYDGLREDAAEALTKLPAAATLDVLAVLLDSFAEFHGRGGHHGLMVMTAAETIVANNLTLVEALRPWAHHDHPHGYAEQIVVRYPQPEPPDPLPPDDAPRVVASEHGGTDTLDEVEAEVGALLTRLRDDLATIVSALTILPEAVGLVESDDILLPAALFDSTTMPGRQPFPDGLHALIAVARRGAAVRPRVPSLLAEDIPIVRVVVATALARAPEIVKRPRMIEPGQLVVIDLRQRRRSVGGQELRPTLLSLLDDGDLLVRRLALAGLCTVDGLDVLHQEDAGLTWWTNGYAVSMAACWMEACAEATVALLQLTRPRPGIHNEAASRALIPGTPASLAVTDVLLTYLKRPVPDLSTLSLCARVARYAVPPTFLGVPDPRVVDVLLARKMLSLLELIAPDSPQVRAALLDWIAIDQDDMRRSGALHVLSEVAGDDPVVMATAVERLEDPDKYMREEAINVLSNFGTVPLEVFEAVRARLHDEENVVQWAAWEGFIRLRILEPGPIDAWWPLLDADDPWVALTAAKVLMAGGARAPHILTRLFHTLTAANHLCRKTAYSLLAEYKDVDDRLLDALLDRLQAQDEWGNGPRQVLGALDAATPEVVEALYAQLEADEFVSSDTLHALVALASRHPDVATALRRRLAARWNDLPASLEKLLATLPDSAYVTLLCANIAWEWDQSGWTPGQEVETLAGLPEHDPVITTALLDRLRRSASTDLHETVVRALMMRGDGSAEVIRALMEQLTDPVPEVRRLSVLALGHLSLPSGPLHDQVIAQLVAMLDDDLGVCAAAARMLARFAAGNPDVRTAAATRLGHLHGDTTAARLLASVAADPNGEHNGGWSRPLPLRVRNSGSRLPSDRLSWPRWR